MRVNILKHAGMLMSIKIKIKNFVFVISFYICLLYMCTQTGKLKVRSLLNNIVERSPRDQSLSRTGYFSSPECPDCRCGPWSLFNEKWEICRRFKAAGSWSWPVPTIWCQGWESKQLYLFSIFMPSWLGQWQFEDSECLGYNAVFLGEWFPSFWKDHGTFTITFQYEGPTILQSVRN